jgi:hypothetical protein
MPLEADGTAGSFTSGCCCGEAGLGWAGDSSDAGPAESRRVLVRKEAITRDFTGAA